MLGVCVGLSSVRFRAFALCSDGIVDLRVCRCSVNDWVLGCLLRLVFIGFDRLRVVVGWQLGVDYGW